MARAKVLASGLDRMVHPINELRSTVLNAPSPEQLALPFFNLLPKDPVELLRWKIYVRERAAHDLEFRADIEDMCKKDICFFAATFCWVFEPRPPRGIPLTPWCDQADALAWMVECYEMHRDLGGEKSRGIGFSWDVAIFCYWVWKYTPDAKIALTTKDETTLDGPDANSLLGKFAYIHEKMPAWSRLHPATGKDILRRTSEQHLLINTRNGAVCQGFAPTDSKLRSLRFTVVIYDEFAYFPRNAQESLNASVHTAPCRMFISTWHGHDNEFHQIMRVEKSTMLRIQSYWWANSERWKGAYTTENGRLKVLDGDYKFPKDYPFILDGMLRSAWVDFELRRPGYRKQTSLEELYGLSASAGRKLFRTDTIAIVESTVRPPMYEGDIDCTGPEIRFRHFTGGPIHLYEDIGNGKGGPFSAACDLGEGLMATPSTLEIISLKTGRQVLDFADNEIKPVDFAAFVFDVMTWLCGPHGHGHCFIDFEANGGQATTFGNELVRLGAGNVRQRAYRRPTKGQEPGGYLGTRNSDGGLALLSELERAIRDGDCTVLSAEILAEMRTADKDEKGKPTFHGIENSHGDRTQGLALSWGQAKDKLIELPADMTENQQRARSEIEDYIAKPRSWAESWGQQR